MYGLGIKLIATFFAATFIQKSLQTNSINQYFETINSEFKEINSVAAKLTWDSMVNPDINLVEKSTDYMKDQVNWQHRSCARLSALQNHHLLNSTQERQTYLLCRGPKFSFGDARQEIYLRDVIQSQYSNAEICFKSSKSMPNISDIEKIILKHIIRNEVVRKPDEFCIRGEDDFQNVMTNSRNKEVLKFIWMEWRKIVSTIKVPYMKLIDLDNKAAQSNGYSDIGETWRDELEIPDIRILCRKLFNDIRPLYIQLHGVVRFFVKMFYGGNVTENGPIPAHLLGDLWGQNWDSLSNIMIPTNLVDLDGGLRKLNWTTEHMITRVEDFYQSLGLPPLNELFWKNSVFKKMENNEMSCHGTAADMFTNSDYRLLYCAGNSIYDFYVLHHEIGHIQYYMAYEQQAGIFQVKKYYQNLHVFAKLQFPIKEESASFYNYHRRKIFFSKTICQGANSAFHESIGDTIMLGVLTPQHLNRLAIINDTVLYSQEKAKNQDKKDITIDAKDIYNVFNDINPSELILLKQALKELPEIAFGLVLDEYRWELFEGNINEDEINKRYWSKVLEVQGIAPPGDRGEEYFDVAAKYHVADHTPYIRYFLSSFLHHQVFEELCKAAVFGRRGVLTPLPDSIALHKCDIYGSKSAGRILKDIMSQGSSKKWDETLFETTGKSIISSDSLLRYYQPLQPILARIIRNFDIPLGW